MGFTILLSLVYFRNFHNKKLKKNFGLWQISLLCFYVKFSSWLNYPKSCAQSNIFPLWRQFRSPWHKVTLSPVDLHAFSFIGNSRKTMASWRLYSISLSWCIWARGWGGGGGKQGWEDSAQAPFVFLRQHRPSARFQLGGQHSAVDIKSTSVLLGLGSCIYNSSLRCEGYRFFNEGLHLWED